MKQYIESLIKQKQKKLKEIIRYDITWFTLLGELQALETILRFYTIKVDILDAIVYLRFANQTKRLGLNEFTQTDETRIVGYTLDGESVMLDRLYEMALRERGKNDK